MQDYISPESKDILQKNFIKTINGYHILSKEPIKEARWEEINAEVLINSDYKIDKLSSGAHNSGCDIVSSLGNLSNKTAKINKNCISISSYRLTTVCDKKNVGDIKKCFRCYSNQE
jgi:hypothetical protein